MKSIIVRMEYLCERVFLWFFFVVSMVKCSSCCFYSFLQNHFWLLDILLVLQQWFLKKSWVLCNLPRTSKHSINEHNKFPRTHTKLICAFRYLLSLSGLTLNWMDTVNDLFEIWFSFIIHKIFNKIFNNQATESTQCPPLTLIQNIENRYKKE